MHCSSSWAWWRDSPRRRRSSSACWRSSSLRKAVSRWCSLMRNLTFRFNHGNRGFFAGFEWCDDREARAMPASILVGSDGTNAPLNPRAYPSDKLEGILFMVPQNAKEPLRRGWLFDCGSTIAAGLAESLTSENIPGCSSPHSRFCGGQRFRAQQPSRRSTSS